MNMTQSMVFVFGILNGIWFRFFFFCSKKTNKQTQYRYRSINLVIPGMYELLKKNRFDRFFALFVVIKLTKKKKKKEITKKWNKFGLSWFYYKYNPPSNSSAHLTNKTKWIDRIEVVSRQIGKGINRFIQKSLSNNILLNVWKITN